MRIYSHGEMIEAASGAAQEVYSTGEQRIGTWIDGKPVYRRIFNGQSGGQLNDTITVGTVYDVDMTVELRGIIFGVNNSPDRIDPIPSKDFTLFHINGNINISPHAIAFTNKQCLVFISYTKTTDQATIQLPAALTVDMPTYTAAPQSGAAAELKADFFNEEA